MSTVLVVDDEPQMTMIIQFALETQGLTVRTAHDGATALNVLRKHDVDLVVLDVLMPTLDGLTLCELIRARSDVPIMLLTALGQHEDVIAGLERGADDYVIKPFHPREVALRAQALVRRGKGGGEGTVLRAGPLVIDTAQQTVTVSGTRVELPYTEYKLLAHLALHRGTPQSWQTLLRAVWGTSALRDGRNVVKSTVYRLRSHLPANDAGGYVQTVRGVGYLMPDL